MKITQGQLRQIIKEELERNLREGDVKIPGVPAFHPLYRTDAAGFPLRGFGGRQDDAPGPRQGLGGGHMRPGPSWHMMGTGYRDDTIGPSYFDRETDRLLQGQETVSGSVYAKSPGVPADGRYTLRLDGSGYVATVMGRGMSESSEGHSDFSAYDAVMQCVEALSLAEL